MPNDRYDHLLDHQDSETSCQACGDNGIIDMGMAGDIRLLYYCNYCDVGKEHERVGFIKEMIII